MKLNLVWKTHPRLANQEQLGLDVSAQRTVADAHDTARDLLEQRKTCAKS